MAEQLERIDGIGHGRKDGADAALSAHARPHPGFQPAHGQPPDKAGYQRIQPLEQAFQQKKTVLDADPGQVAVKVFQGFRVFPEQFPDIGAALYRPEREDKQQGTMTQRDQYETLSRLKNHQPGSQIISAGMAGTVRQGTWPNVASRMRVKTLTRSAPPLLSTQAQARRIASPAGSQPTVFRAK